MTLADVQSLVFRKRDGGHPAAAGQLRNLLKRMFDYAMANGPGADEPGGATTHALCNSDKVARSRALSR